MFKRKNLVVFLLLLLLSVSSQAQLNDKRFTNKFTGTAIPVAFANADSIKTSIASISTVSGEKLRGLNNAVLGNTLMGMLPGLYIEQTAGSPGNNNPGMLLRGRQSFVDNGFITLVDGFETKWSNLMVDEIESVSVLKDAAALALYGLDGANGVILITTKRGKESKKNTIRFNSRFGIQQPTVLPKFLGNGDYAEMYNTALASDGKAITAGYFSTPDIVNNFKNGTQPYLFPNVDWYSEMLKPQTLSQDYSLSIDGGNRTAKYYVALGYLNNQGLYSGIDSRRMLNKNLSLERFNIRSNVDVQITDWLLSEVKLRGTMEQKAGPNADENTLWRTMALFNPYPVKTPEGNWGGKEGYSANPIASILQQGYKTVNERTIDANLKLNAKLDFVTEGLSVYGQVNFINNYWSTYDKTRGYSYAELTPDYASIVPGVTPEGVIPYISTIKGTTDNAFNITQGSGSQWNRTSFIGGAEFDRTFGVHHISASALYNQDLYNAAGSDAAYAKQALMGRVKYDFKSKYLAELGYSYAGSENFPSGKRFGFFPSLAAGWVLSEESFLKDNTVLTFAKLRASAGITGSDRVGSVGRFIFNQYYLGSGSYLLGGTNFDNPAPMYKEGNLINQNVTWEKALKYNIGFDAVAFNRLSVSLDLFEEFRNDIYVNPSAYIPGLIGTDFYSVNGGKTKNIGFEADLRYNDNIGKFHYNIGGRASFAKNEIVDMKEPVRKEEYLYGKGNPISQPFMLEAIGFFKDASDIKNSPAQLFGAVQAGDIKYKDQNGDGFIDDNDRIPVGYTSYPELYYSFDLNADYKGFDFSIMFQGSAMRSISLLDNNNVIPFLNGGVKPTQWVKDNYWTVDRGDNALFPRLTTESNSNNYRASTLWQRDGSFIRLKNIELGYSLNEKLLAKVKLEKIRLFVSANNLFTWDKINEINIDPEIRNMFTYPSMKNFNVGLMLQF
jgi:TonB-linked SusC/RagA family outer membrane protein